MAKLRFEGLNVLHMDLFLFSKLQKVWMFYIWTYFCFQNSKRSECMFSWTLFSFFHKSSKRFFANIMYSTLGFVKNRQNDEFSQNSLGFSSKKSSFWRFLEKIMIKNRPQLSLPKLQKVWIFYIWTDFFFKTPKGMNFLHMNLFPKK